VNVAIGRSSAPLTEERLTASIRQAGAEDVVADLPRGLDTLLAKHFSGGHELSGGQWQRLGIARAAYRRGRILIVDEPTAALDARAEVEVFDKIRALAAAGQTVVLITHRLASVRHADLVHVLAQGRLVETGTPEELLAKGGLYAELYALQAEQFTLRVGGRETPGAGARREDPAAAREEAEDKAAGREDAEHKAAVREDSGALAAAREDAEDTAAVQDGQGAFTAPCAGPEDPAVKAAVPAPRGSAAG
jgi:ATP-binding cassette subfamily B protein